MNHLKRVITSLCMLFVLGFAANAQAVPDHGQPTSFIAIGGAYNGASGNAWATYGKSIGAGFWSLTSYDVTLASRKPLTFQYSGRTGVGFDVTTIAPSLSFGGRVHLMELVDAGGAGSQNAAGFAYSPLGGFGSYDFGSKLQHLQVTGGARLVETTAAKGVIVELGLVYPLRF